MTKILQVTQTNTLVDMVHQLNQVLRRISDMLASVPAAVAASVCCGLTRDEIIALIRTYATPEEADLSVYGAFVWTVPGNVCVSSMPAPLLRCDVPGGVVPESATLDVITAPEGSTTSGILCDIWDDGTSIFASSDQVSIPSSTTTATSTEFSVTNIAQDSILRLIVSAVGSNVAGAGLTATLRVRQAVEEV